MVETAQLCETLHRTAKIFASYRKSLSVNPFSVTNLRPNVESMHLLCMRRMYCRLKHVALDRLRVRLNVILFAVNFRWMIYFYIWLHKSYVDTASS